MKTNFNENHGSAIRQTEGKVLSIGNMMEINHRMMGGGMSQAYSALYFLEYYIREFGFRYVIEFGTQKGALALYLANMAAVTEGFIFDSYEISKTDFYSRPDEGVGHWLMRLDSMSNYINIHLSWDLFNQENILVLAEQIKSAGKTLIIADGGNKAKEFQIYSEYLKTGDHICLHDWGTEVNNGDTVTTEMECNMKLLQPWANYAGELRTLFRPFYKIEL